MDQNTAAPPGLSLKLKVTFLAFLAVLPALLLVAALNVMEGDDKTREREWQATRANTAAAVAAWFDSTWKDVLLSLPPKADDGGERPGGAPSAAAREALIAGFDDLVRRTALPDIGIFWNRGTATAPDLSCLGARGEVSETPDAEILKALREGNPLYRSRSAEAHEILSIQVTLPIRIDGEPRVVARFIVTGQAWNAGRGLVVAGAIESWVESTCGPEGRARLLAAWRAQVATGEVTDVAALRQALLSSVETLRDRLRLLGLTLFWVGPQRDLEVLLVSGGGPQTSSPLDRDVVRTGHVSHPQGVDVTQVALPLTVRINRGGALESRIVAVAHFEVPPPPPKGSAARAFLIAMIALMLLVLGFLFFYMNQAISQPIQRLIGAMARGTEGELQPIAQSGGGEVAILAEAFNRLVQKRNALDAENRGQRERIHGFNVELKSKLEQRTRELEAQSGKLLDLERKVAGQERLTALGQLAGTMAHELGTPLNAMGGHVELLLSEEATLAPEVVKRLRLIGAQIERLSSIIQRTLHQLRTPAPQFRPVDLNELVQGIVTLVTPTLTGRKVTLRTSLAPGLPRVSGDPGQLEQVLMNLVNNAADAMPAGGTLDLLTAGLEGSVCLQVRDSGVGIPREDLAQIFDAFYTTKRPGQGTGLGLAIVQEIVKRHHGTIEVQSEAGKGTWFTVRFPGEVKVEAGPAGAPVVPAARGTAT